MDGGPVAVESAVWAEVVCRSFLPRRNPGRPVGAGTVGHGELIGGSVVMDVARIRARRGSIEDSKHIFNVAEPGRAGHGPCERLTETAAALGRNGHRGRSGLYPRMERGRNGCANAAGMK